MKDYRQQLLDLLAEEIKLFTNWRTVTTSGGWSTHLNDAMKKRTEELALLYFIISEEKDLNQ